MTIENFFRSGWDFGEHERELRSKVQMINIAITLSSISLLYGIIGNIVRDVSGLIPFEVALISINLLLFYILRKDKNSFHFVALVETLQFSMLFLFLIYTNEPSALKHVWIFTYPIVLLYFQNDKNAFYWVAMMIFMLLVAPFLPFLELKYSLYQLSYISFVLLVMSLIIYFYQLKMNEAKALILEQQKIMNRQAKHAVMGEMISMIAHQWRQPLSTVTLSISNLQIKRLLGETLDEKELEKSLETISNTVVYLSETIDDFQTFFNPHREITAISVDDIITKAKGFAMARVKDTNVKIIYTPTKEIVVETYINELVQVILNILNNAIDELVHIKREDATVSISIVEQRERVKIIIKDNANGIKEEDMDKIFDPYYSTKGKNGTGLGLYMSQMIMQKQFGTKIDVSSSKNGASFAIIVPKKLL